MLFTLPDPPAFMSALRSPKDDSHRPRGLQKSMSFRTEPLSPTKTRPNRASTIQNGSIPEIDFEDKMLPENRNPSARSAVFAKMPENSAKEQDGENMRQEDVAASTGTLPVDFDELPIELISLTDSFIDSLSAKIHPTPPTAENLSGLFQDFYITASNAIQTHISALSSRQHRANSRQSSPAPSARSATNIFRAKAASISNKEQPRPIPERKNSEQQMLTQTEIADRKKARKLLEQKRVALEEAVERRVCECIYDNIWRHHSTQDEAQDEKLRSKTAALSVVGIGLTDLGVDLGNEEGDVITTEEKEVEVREWLEDARQELVFMNDKQYPLGKLQHLKAAHKGIVDTLSHFHPSSSADEIMPMLIYTLITSPPEGINVVSNLCFIQRFRNEAKIDGEAAYCLTNLEAALTFLETVDLASLRADESLAGPARPNSRPPTPMTDKPSFITPSTASTKTSISPAVAISADNKPRHLSVSTSSKESLRPLLSPSNRRVSDFFQPQAQALGDASDAVLKTADQGLKTIGNSLGDSYKFLVGKLKERQEQLDGTPEVRLPRTLDEARLLMTTPPPEDLDEDEPIVTSGASSTLSSSPKLDDKLLNAVGTKRPSRKASVESVRSASSGKKVGFAESVQSKSASPLSASSLATANPAIAETMRNLGNTLNPLGRLSAGMGMMKGFGRQAAAAPTIPSVTSLPTSKKESEGTADGGVTDLVSAHPHLAALLPPKEKIAPPIKRFMEVENPGELRINEVLELLRDYRRLAEHLKDLGAV